ncbi:uncharacterized protein LOC111619490 [Centruroides sculpturatus]|uniref:uncharacterized protein LOC111619490 n=1 Tax=Centruroides sculpturatus TaxID=218467 RepID=UPI000C6E96CB|nr:uncharacterized protein LOC111619490 [Centruroides sculpturatus]
MAEIDKLDKFEIDESGKLKIVKKLPKGQHFLKLQQQDKHYAKSSQNVKIKDVGNNEALIVIQFGKPEIIEEKKKVVFLHSTPFYKFFLPNAPLSDYNFEIKVISDGGVDEQIRIKNNSDIFSIDPVNNEIFPLKDISILENFQTVLTVEAINFVDEKLDIYIYQLHEENCLNISISTNISVLLSKSQIERNITGILQQQNNYQEMSFHILKYYLKDSNNNMKNYEIISTILHNKTLLTYKEMKDKFTDVQQQIQNSFGSFKLTSFLKEIRDKDENGNHYHFMMIIFGSLAAFLLIIIIISFIFSRLKNITGILQQQNNYQEMSFHILKYYLKDSNNNMKNYEIISTILHNKTLLTYKEMKDKFTDVQQQIQNSFGSFKLTSFLKEIRDKDENGNHYHFMMIIFGSLAAFLLIIIIISFIFSRLK